MLLIIKFSSEIIIKSRPVRIFFIKVLVRNIRFILKKNNESALVLSYWDYLEIKCDNINRVRVLLENIPGIHHILIVQKSIFSCLQDIHEKVISIYYDILQHTSFCVRVKRSGIHDFTSKEVECYLGNMILQNIKGSYVDLTNPEKIIFLEIKKNYCFIILHKHIGLGGFPIGTQQELLSLVSGGFDSSVSSYMLMRRGCKVHYCFFYFGDATNIGEVYKIVYFLWNKFGSSHKVKFITIDFTKIVKEIVSKVTENQIGVVLKRMMIRAASLVADSWKVNALMTGEVLGQVSSQTLDNLKLIDNVSNTIIFRPLIAYDKEVIINISKKIGTEVFSKNIPEYCAISPKKSTNKAIKKNIEFEESSFNYIEILKESVSSAYVIDIRNIPSQIAYHQHFFSVETSKTLSVDNVVLDIRAKSEQARNPLILSNVKILKISFYELIDQCSKLDPSKTYLLYCDHGIMSRWQAINLYKKGFYNIKIYRPDSINKNIKDN